MVTSAILLFGASSFARIGIVRTLTGENLEGHVRVTAERVIVVNAGRGQVYGIELTNIALISFPVAAPAANAGDLPSESLPEGWRETDIGAARRAGSTRYGSGTFTVRGAGANIDGEGDSFHYVYKPVHGDSEIVADVVSIQYTHPNAKAGLMMRESLGEYSRNVMVALTAMRGGIVQVRGSEHFNTEAMPARAMFAPHWLRLKRRGNEFSAYASLNGRVWSLIEKATVTMNENFYVGLAVASANESMLNWTTFSKVREGPRLTNEDFIPEVELVSGSIVVGRPKQVDENEVTFADGPKLVRVATERVARIAYQPLTSELSWKTRVSRPGVWVSNGDFFDGEFRNIQAHKLAISSVLYGLRTFDIDEEVLAVVLHPRQSQRVRYEIETADGSMLRASDVALGDGEIKLREFALGEVRVPAFEILELHRR
jgi:regulation of enolase protein 1 (concanavalin A-like superfamily)